MDADLELTFMFIDAVIQKDWDTARRLAFELDQGEQLSLFTDEEMEKLKQ